MEEDDNIAFPDPECGGDDTICPHCFQEPCFLEQGLHNNMMEYYETQLCHEDGSPIFPNNKSIRFRLYKYVTAWIHGILGKGVRLEIPPCVRDEIIGLAPEDDHVYVGFKFTGAIDFKSEKENVVVQAGNKSPSDRPSKRIKTSGLENVDTDEKNPECEN